RCRAGLAAFAGADRARKTVIAAIDDIRACASFAIRNGAFVSIKTADGSIRAYAPVGGADGRVARFAGVVGIGSAFGDAGVIDHAEASLDRGRGAAAIAIARAGRGAGESVVAFVGERAANTGRAD